MRLAGLLHDIGHYPLSHVCEFPYKMNPAAFPTDDYCKNVNARVKEKVDHFSDAATWRFRRDQMDVTIFVISCFGTMNYLSKKEQKFEW